MRTNLEGRFSTSSASSSPILSELGEEWGVTCILLCPTLIHSTTTPRVKGLFVNVERYRVCGMILNHVLTVDTRHHVLTVIVCLNM